MLCGGARLEFFELGILGLKTTRFWVKRDQCGVRNPPRVTAGASKAQGGAGTGGGGSAASNLTVSSCSLSSGHWNGGIQVRTRARG